MKQSKPNRPGRVLPEPFQKPPLGVVGRAASSYWTKLSWLHMKMAENPLDLWPKMRQFSFLHTLATILRFYQQGEQLGLMSTSVHRTQLYTHSYTIIVKFGRGGVNFPGLRQWEWKVWPVGVRKRKKKHISIITGGSSTGCWAVQTPLRVHLSDFYQLIFHRFFFLSGYKCIFQVPPCLIKY